MNNIHVINEENRALLFNGETFKIYELNSYTKEIFSLYEKGYNSEFISTKLEVPKDKVDTLIESIIEEKFIEEEREEKILGAYLMITQDCNLRCKYCYADYGKYGMKAKLMTRETAKEAVDYLFRLNYNLKFIQFFGGEPSLNVDIIEFIINYIKQLYEMKKIKRIPMFSIVSNLVNIDDRFIKVVKDNKINITVSIDGPKEIHDLLRIKINSEATYSQVISNYNRLVENGVTPSIEATYTSYHVGKITMLELYKYFNENFKYRTIFISPIACSMQHPLYIKDQQKLINDKIEAMEFILDSMVTNNPINSANIQDILEILLMQKKKGENFFICPDGAGIYQLAINADGDVYPCYALVNRNELKMENIFRKDRLQFLNQQNRFRKINKDNEKCKGCWARNLCSICLANQVFKGKEYGQFDNSVCDEKKMYLEMLINKLIEIQSNEKNIEKFRENFYLNDQR